MAELDKNKKCFYCDKGMDGEGISIYYGGKLDTEDKLIVAYCSVKCMNKATKAMSLILRKMSREQLFELIGVKQESEKQEVSK